MIFSFLRSAWSLAHHQDCVASLYPLSKYGCGTAGLALASLRGNGDPLHYVQSPKSVIWTLHILSGDHVKGKTKQNNGLNKFWWTYAKVIWMYCSHFFMLSDISKRHQLSNKTKEMIWCYWTALSLVVYLPHLGFYDWTNCCLQNSTMSRSWADDALSKYLKHIILSLIKGKKKMKGPDENESKVLLSKALLFQTFQIRLLKWLNLELLRVWLFKYIASFASWSRCLKSKIHLSPKFKKLKCNFILLNVL